LTFCRPTWELRCGMTTLGEKLSAAAHGATGVACFVPPYMADVYRSQTAWPVNDPASLRDDDLLVAAGWVKADGLALVAEGPSRVALDAGGEVLLARITRDDLARLPADSIESLLAAAKESLPVAAGGAVPAWNYPWELVLANAGQLIEDFRAAGRSGIEGTLEKPSAIRGPRGNLYVARGATVHPMTVLDATAGPIYVDEGAEIQPFTRIEGPCYVGKQSILLGAKCRRGNTIGPVCRVGGEVEQSILHGYTNKYHDGFLGHAYVGQWVNLGAGTTNSDLRNDYGRVKVVLDGRTAIDTGSNKVGALIGDHVKTCIGTLLNTGATVGAMAQLATPGVLLPKFIPSFAWLRKGAVSEGPDRRRLYETARLAASRRGVAWTEADEAMWDEVYQMTAEIRRKAEGGGRKEERYPGISPGMVSPSAPATQSQGFSNP
jgi:UDP-N-acetylglucosamine diphosphorylase/glucosamine-1-phosphate N-acetyltransferase